MASGTRPSVAASRPGCSRFSPSGMHGRLSVASTSKALAQAQKPSPICCQGYGAEAGFHVPYRAIVSRLRLRLGCGKHWKWLLFPVESSEVS